MKATQRLDKLLSNFGYGTRKEVKELVKAGSVSVDGIAAKDAGMQVNPEESRVEINGERLNYREFVYVMMNKPDGVVSATYDPRKRTVVDILPEELRCFDLFPVGRLDIDTEGLLIMTNDGKLAHELLSPKKHVPKKYYALVEGTVGESDIREFSEGIVLDDGYKTMPGELDIIKAAAISEVEVTINEGKFHQVKRMFDALGKKVKYLRRIEMGGLKLDESLKAGECRELTSAELEMLKQQVGSTVQAHRKGYWNK